MNKIISALVLPCLIVSVSCSEAVQTKEPAQKTGPDKSKFEAYAIMRFAEDHKNGIAKAENIRVDTALAISSRRAERIKAETFQRDYEFFCKTNGITYDPQLERDSVNRWLKRAYKLPANDTVAYRVKFNLDYIIDGEPSPNMWIKAFNTNYEPVDLDGPLLEEEHFLVEKNTGDTKETTK